MHAIKLPVVDKKCPRDIGVETYPILLPHEVLTFLFDHVGVVIDPARVEEYWKHSRLVGEPWSLAHPASDQHIPIGIHGDGARLWTVQQMEKHFAISLNLVLFRPRSTRYSRWVLFSIPTEKILKNRTLNRVWRKIAWSINLCFSGLGPEGRPLTKQHLRFALTEIRGDQEFHRDCWRPTSSWLSKTMVCFKCPAAARGPAPYLYWNNGSDCAWDREEFSLETFVTQRLKEKQLCCLAVKTGCKFLFTVDMFLFRCVGHLCFLSNCCLFFHIERI